MMKDIQMTLKIIMENQVHTSYLYSVNLHLLLNFRRDTLIHIQGEGPMFVGLKIMKLKKILLMRMNQKTTIKRDLLLVH